MHIFLATLSAVIALTPPAQAAQAQLLTLTYDDPRPLAAAIREVERRYALADHLRGSAVRAPE